MPEQAIEKAGARSPKEKKPSILKRKKSSVVAARPSDNKALAKADATSKSPDKPKPKAYEKLFDMPFGVDEYSTGIKRFNRVPASVIVGTVSGICKVLYRYKVKNADVLFKEAEKGGVVVISNHTSYLDVVFMYLSMWPKQWPRFIARDSLFQTRGPLGWIFAHIGAFPIKRDTADRSAVKRAARMLKNGEIVGIMPEGSRRGKGSAVPRVHGGAALIARMGKAPIVPMAVHNVDVVKRKGERLRFPTVTVEYGNPVHVSDFDFLPKEDRLDACVWYALRECFAMFQNKAPEDVDMAALFPEDKDFTQAFADHPIK